MLLRCSCIVVIFFVVVSAVQAENELSECKEALGMENYVILNDQLSASSHWISQPSRIGESNLTYGAEGGRLNNGWPGSWTPALNKQNKDQWLQIYFGSHPAKVTRVASQGSFKWEEWVTSYKLQYGDDGENVQYYKEQGQNTEKVFSGNTDQNTVVPHDLNPPITAHYIRFRPVTWESRISMRVELYGCIPACAVGYWKRKDVVPPVISQQTTWLSLPSIVKIAEGHYQALGRFTYVENLKEQLRRQKHLNFAHERKTMDLVKQLDVLVDTLYVEGVTELFGIQKLNIYARKILAKLDSKIILSSPDWIQEYQKVITPGTVNTNGSNGENGKHGVHGPQVHVFCNSVRGKFIVTANGGNGHKGQNGGRGADGLRGEKGRSKTRCKGSIWSCSNRDGDQGGNGTDGTNGGDAGEPGKGGNAGYVYLRSRKVRGKVILKSCAGLGAEPAKNGEGGKGGPGGEGGKGKLCSLESVPNPGGGISLSQCVDKGTSQASAGFPGQDGEPGKTLSVKGQDGAVNDSLVQSGQLNAVNKESFPKELLLIMKRQGEDLLLGDSKDRNGRDALEFIRDLTVERSDVEQIREEVNRKLRFLDGGHDIFGQNILFFPRNTWENLLSTIEDYKEDAKSYETTFNEIISAVMEKDNFQQLTSTIVKTSSNELEGERRRLVEDMRVAQSEKKARLAAIRALEVKLNDIQKYIQRELTKVAGMAKFHEDDVLAVLEGLVGLAMATQSKDPLSSAAAVLGLFSSMSGKLCLKTLEKYSESIKKGLNFGQAYKNLVDSSELDFDTLDITLLPEMMQVDLDMKKEKLSAELVCLFENSREIDVAEFQAELESFFAVGAARIDLIAILLELDNQIGGDMYDIKVVEDTKKAIVDAGRSPDTPITTDVRKTFTDTLLREYSELEESFLRELHQLVRAFQFLTLWEAGNPLSSFRRLATDSAYGTGRLNGDVQLTKVLNNAKTKFLSGDCLLNAKYTFRVWKYSFDTVKNKVMFDKLHSNGNTTFGIDIDESCKTCYNARLLKIHIELFGPEDQPENVPANVNIKFRHHSSSYFRAGDNSIKHYRQKESGFGPGNYTYYSDFFDRHTTSDATKCRENGGSGIHCGITRGDDRRFLRTLCDDPIERWRAKGRKVYKKTECKSPFGVYELKIPVDSNLECSDATNKEANCKDLDLKKFTNMNVFAYVLYWNDHYPTGPNDPLCKKKKKKDQAAFNQE